MKTGWKIIVGVVIVCVFIIAFALIQRLEPPKRISVELPTVVLSQSQLTGYPRPELYPDAHNIQVKLVTRLGCIDNCESFEPLKGLGVRITEFQTSSPREGVFSFYRKTLTASGWEFDKEYSNIDNIYHFQKGDGPEFLLYISIDNMQEGSHVYLHEEISVPFTWPNS